jgi:hypothetical protein
VVITRHEHPLKDQEFEVLMDGNERIVIRLEDGTSMRIPRGWTNADGTSNDGQPGRIAVFNIDSLRRLLELVEAFLQRS